MSICGNNLHLATPYLIFQSCVFQEPPKPITKGGQANILCGTMKATGEQKKIVVKAFWSRAWDQDNEQCSKLAVAVESELRIWGMLCAHNDYHIASFLGIVPIHQYNSNYFPKGLVSNYYTGGDLNEFLRQTDRNCGDYEMRHKMLVEIIRGIGHIHAHSVVHGDLKADNILVDADKTARIGDFGSSRIDCWCYNGPESLPSTIRWDSPELWYPEETKGTFRSDVWAFGCIALEVQMNMSPWDPQREGNERKALRRQFRSEGGYPAQEADLDLGNNPILNQVWDVMKECWQKDPAKRPAASTLITLLENIQISPA